MVLFQVANDEAFAEFDGDVFKIIMLGATGGGKTCLLSTSVKHETFNNKIQPSMNTEFLTVKMQRPDWSTGEPNQYIMANIWDTAGQERYNAVSNSYFRRTHGVLVVFDVTSSNSLHSCFKNTKGKESWLDQARSCSDDTQFSQLSAVMLVENKIDLLTTCKKEDINEVSKDVSEVKKDASEVNKDESDEPPRPSDYAQVDVIKTLLETYHFKTPSQGADWLKTASTYESQLFLGQASLLYARTSAKTKECKFYQIGKPSRLSVSDMVKTGCVYKTVEYEKQEKVSSFAQALEMMMTRIYYADKDRPKDKSFHLRAGNSSENSQASSCC